MATGRRSKDRRRRPAPLLAGIAMVVLSAPPASGHPAIPSTLFDPAEILSEAAWDMTETDFADYFDTKSRDGFMVVDLEVDVTAGRRSVATIFEPNPLDRRWMARIDLTSDELNAVGSQARQDGMRPVDHETYVVGNTRLYAGVWIENVEGYRWTSYRNVTVQTHVDLYDRYRKGGLMMIDVEIFRTAAGMRYSALWVENAEGLLWAGLQDLTSQALADTSYGYRYRLRMLDVESYPTPSGRRYAGIWIENVGDRDWFDAVDLTAAEFANEHSRKVDEGYRLVDFERYASPAGPRYAGVWRQNSDRPDWQLRDVVDDRITKELDDFDVPGISVAVARDGEMLYRRGFGYADVDEGTWMDSLHVQRLASVSKAVAGVLLMQMVESGDVDVHAKSVDLVPGLPAHHTHEVGQLASNRGCVRHYQAGKDGFGGGVFDSALDAAKEFWDDPLVCTPGQPFYSTHAYTILAAALEQVSGTPHDQLLRNLLTVPFELDTLRAEDLEDGSVRRTQIYSWDGQGNHEIARDRLDWKVFGGGMEASAVDLTRFGVMLSNGEILDEDRLEELWTPPDAASNYAYGWTNGTQAGHFAVGKDGGQPGAKSYLLVYPDDYVVVSVLTNRGDGGHNAVQLARDIGKLVLDWIDAEAATQRAMPGR